MLHPGPNLPTVDVGRRVPGLNAAVVAVESGRGWIKVDMDNTAAVLDVLRERFSQIQDEERGRSPLEDIAPDDVRVIVAVHYAVDGPLRPALDAAGLPLPAAVGVAFAPGDRRADLVRAAALLIAEIERLDRAGPAPPTVPAL